MNVGSFMEGLWSIEAFEDNAYRVQIVGSSVISVIDAGESFQDVESSTGEVGGLALPKTVRDGMEFRVGTKEFKVELAGTRQVWGRERRVWRITGLGSYAQELIEGLGPTEGGYGVLVADSQLKGLNAGARVQAKEMPGGVTGMSRMDSVATSGHRPMLLINAKNQRADFTRDAFQPKDFCSFVHDGEEFDWAENVRSVGPGPWWPSVDACPTTLADDGDGKILRGSAGSGIAFETGITFYNPGLFASFKLGDEGYVLSEGANDQFEAGRVTRYSAGQDAEVAERGGFQVNEWGRNNHLKVIHAYVLDQDVQERAGRVLLTNDEWVYAAALDPAGPRAPLHGYYLPGAQSVQLRDETRVVTRTSPDGLVHRLEIVDGDLDVSREGRASAPPIETKWGGAIHHGSELIMMVNTPTDWISSDPYFFRIPLDSSPAKIPSSLGVRLAKADGSVRICLPPGEDVSSTGLTLNGKAPLHLYRAEDEDGGCEIAVPDPPFSEGVTVELELKDVGTVTSYVETTVTEIVGVPQRDQTIQTKMWTHSAHGVLKRRAPHGELTANNTFVDAGGHGLWFIDTSGARLTDSALEWPALPQATIRRPFSALGRLFVTRDSNDGGGCAWLDKEAHLTDVDCSYGGILAELDDGTQCFNGAGGIFCGAIEDFASAVPVPVPDIAQIMPYGRGFYFRSEPAVELREGPAPLFYYDADTAQVSELDSLEGPFRVADDLMLAVDGPRVLRLSGGQVTEVFDAQDLPDWNDFRVVTPLDGVVLVGSAPIEYDPRAGNCSEQAEECNGVDDNCNGEVDEEQGPPLCAAENASAECTAQGCALISCAPGFADCDANAENGCEANLESPTTCGSCALSCGATEGCVDGACASGFVRIAGSVDAICATTAPGQVWCLGESRAAGISATPTQVPGLSTASTIRVGDGHACASPHSGPPSCWGINAEEQLPTPSPAILALDEAREQPDFLDTTDLQLGGSISAYIKKNGELWCAGKLCKNLGATQNLYPSPIGTGTDWERLAAGGVRNSSYFLCAVNSAGTLYCAGSPSLGWSTNFTALTSAPLLDLHGGLKSIVARTANGFLGAGSLIPFQSLTGNETLANFSGEPVVLAGLEGATLVRTGEDFVCGLFSGGEVRCSKDFSCSQTATPDASGWYLAPVTGSALATTADAVCVLQESGVPSCAGVDAVFTCDWGEVGFPE